MKNLTVLALRIVLAIVLAGSLFVQVVLVPLIADDLADGGLAVVRVPLVIIVILGIVTIQVSVICLWRLMTMVRQGTVFSHAAFRYVDVIFGAACAASVLTLAFAVTLAIPNRINEPGVADVVAPGIVLLICGLAVIVAGVALLVLVLRMLLAQAVARDAEAQQLQSELDEVI